MSPPPDRVADAIMSGRGSLVQHWLCYPAFFSAGTIGLLFIERAGGVPASRRSQFEIDADRRGHMITRGFSSCGSSSFSRRTHMRQFAETFVVGIGRAW
jgi:hypothetical protein